jgi:hypothetical protein
MQKALRSGYFSLEKPLWKQTFHQNIFKHQHSAKYGSERSLVYSDFLSTNWVHTLNLTYHLVIFNIVIRSSDLLNGTDKTIDNGQFPNIDFVVISLLNIILFHLNIKITFDKKNKISNTIVSIARFHSYFFHRKWSITRTLFDKWVCTIFTNDAIL